MPPFSKNRPFGHFVAVLVGALFALAVTADAQRQPRKRMPNELDDVVFAIAFAPDGRTLAIARGASEPSQRYGRIELWDTESGTLRHLIKGFDGPVRSVSFSPDGRTFVSASSEYRTSRIREKPRSRDGSVFGELKWWDTQTGELKQKLMLPGDGNNSIRATYSPDGKQLAVVESFRYTSLVSTTYSTFVTPGVIVEGDMKLLDAQTGEVQRELKGGQPILAVFSPDGERVAARSLNWYWQTSDIRLWNTRTGRQERKLSGGGFVSNKQPRAIAFSPDGRLLAVAITSFRNRATEHFYHRTFSSEVRLMDVNTWKVVGRLPDLGSVNSLTFATNGRVLLIGGEEDDVKPGVKFWDLHTGKSTDLAIGEQEVNRLVEYLPREGNIPEAVDSLTLSSNGALLALRVGHTAVKMLDTQSWKVKHTFDENSAGDANERATSRFVMSVRRVLAVAFSPDGATISGELEQGEIKLWDHRTGEVKRKLGAGEAEPSLVAIAADGKTTAEVSEGKLRVWNAASESKQTLPMPAGGSISAIALSADGRKLAITTSQDLQILNAGSGEVLKTLAGGGSSPNLIEFSHDGLTLATTDDEGMIEIWDLAEERIAKTINAGSKVTALRLARNGHTLATATEDQAVAIWNLQTGGLQQRLQKHKGVINALAFSADGQLLASGGDDRMVVVWDIASGKSRRTFKDHEQTVTAVAFSPDGTLLASAGGNAAVVVWNVVTGKLNRVLR